MNASRGREEDSAKGMPIQIMKDHESKMRYARAVPRKAVDTYTVDRLKKVIEQLGYKRIVLKSDQETSIKALRQAVKEESPVADYQTNGILENTVNDIKG